jgi:hypothetical protein
MAAVLNDFKPDIDTQRGLQRLLRSSRIFMPAEFPGDSFLEIALG